MGRFVNPGNSAFQVALNSEIYVDKTGLLEYTNARVLSGIGQRNCGIAGCTFENQYENRQ